MGKKELDKKVNKYLMKVKKKNSVIGVWAKNLANNKEFGLGATLPVYTASIIKVPIALTLLHMHEKGEVDLKKSIQLSCYQLRDLGVRDTGILRIFPKDTVVNLEMLLTLMLSISDNAATNIILEFATQKKVNNYMRLLGFKETKLNYHTNDDWLDFEADFDLGSTTAYEMGEILKGIMENRFLSKENSQRILNIMGGLNISNRILRYLPTAKNYWDKKVKIKKYYWKGGTWPRLGICTDLVGLITDKDEEIVISIFTQNISDKDMELRHTAVDHAAPLYIADTGKLIFDYLY